MCVSTEISWKYIFCSVVLSTELQKTH